MTISDDEKLAAEIDEGLKILGQGSSIEVVRREFRSVKQKWKESDPDSFKQDMEEMCKKIFGDQWEGEYQAMLKEEFPDND
jgi:hypothetical protein